MIWIAVFALVFLWGIWRVQSKPYLPDTVVMAGLGLLVFVVPLVGIPVGGLAQRGMALLVLLLASRGLLLKRRLTIQRRER